MSVKIVATCLVTTLSLVCCGSQTLAKDLPVLHNDVRAPASQTLAERPSNAAEAADAQSELRAQWIAANAAVSSAQAAWAAVAVGLLTLVSAVVAAFFAYKAAKHGETSAAQAIRSANAADAAVDATLLAARADLRAWVSVKAELTYLQGSPDDDITGYFAIEIANIGRTPAVNVRVGLSLALMPSKSVSSVGLPDTTGQRAPLAHILPGDTRRILVQRQLAKQQIDDAIEHALSVNDVPIVLVDTFCCYSTVFDGKPADERATSARYTLSPKGFTYTDATEEAAWLRSRLFADTVEMAANHFAPNFVT